MIEIFAMRTSDDYAESEHIQSKTYATTVHDPWWSNEKTKTKNQVSSTFIYYPTHFNRDWQFVPGAYVYSSGPGCSKAD